LKGPGENHGGLMGCTGDFAKKKYFQTLFSQCKLVDMVCRMKSHQGRFQTKSFSCILYVFSCVFSRFAGKNAFLDGFLVVFTVVRLLDPPPFLQALQGTHHVYYYIVYFIK
jgi:hypothetical protein